MRITFKNWTELSEIIKYNKGIKPTYGKGTMKGVVWCSCTCCTGNLLYKKDNEVIGFLDTECTNCGNQIDYSDAYKYL